MTVFLRDVHNSKTFIINTIMLLQFAFENIKNKEYTMYVVVHFDAALVLIEIHVFSFHK